MLLVKFLRWQVACVLLLLVGCSYTTQEVRDGGPAQPVDVSSIPDAVPRAEVRTEAGNKSPYEVLGKTYRVLPESRGFVEEGLASWYGNKFHGRQTSNGELYSMYGMTAAHKTLPIPSYVRVTNLENGRQIVVRVNDRGPFHSGRIIDLTYAGASKLGYLQKGTARVRIEALEADAAPGTESSQTTVADSSVINRPAELPEPGFSSGYQLPANTFLQAGAYSSSTAAEKLRQQLLGLTEFPVIVMPPKADRLYRVRIGPIRDNLALMDLRQLLQQHQLPAPHVIYD